MKAGVPVEAVSEPLRHGSPAFTMTVYSVVPGMQVDVTAMFGDTVFAD